MTIPFTRPERMLSLLIKELKASHRRIAEHEACIAQERQRISAHIEEHQAALALRHAQHHAQAASAEHEQDPANLPVSRSTSEHTSSSTPRQHASR